MLQKAADVVFGCLADQGIALGIKEQVLAVFEQALMNVHAGAIVLEDGLGHEGCYFIMLAADVLDDVFEPHHLVAHLEQVLVFHIDFALPGGGNLVVVDFDLKSGSLHGFNDLGPEVLQGIVGRNGEIAFLVPGFISRGWASHLCRYSSQLRLSR